MKSTSYYDKGAVQPARVDRMWVAHSLVAYEACRFRPEIPYFLPVNSELECEENV